eukprot:3241401-Alexandrium_andersonii.AAC.1
MAGSIETKPFVYAWVCPGTSVAPDWAGQSESQLPYSDSGLLKPLYSDSGCRCHSPPTPASRRRSS